MYASYNSSSADLEMYPLNFSKPGKVYIFNNRNFTHGDESLHSRAGSEKDVQRLFDTFDELNFDVECFLDKTAKELRTYIRKISRDVDYTNIDSVLIFIMSHGKDDKIFGIDGEELYLSDFIQPFKSVEQLKGKPKMFFINACRGNMMAPTHETYNNQNKVEMDTPYLNAAVSRTPIDADILLAFSTVANYFSIRESVYGSWYIQIFCDMIDKYKAQRDILGILTRVNARVAEKESSFINSKGQFELVKMVSTYTSQLKKDFYFTRPSSHVIMSFSKLYQKNILILFFF